MIISFPEEVNMAAFNVSDTQTFGMEIMAPFILLDGSQASLTKCAVAPLGRRPKDAVMPWRQE